VTAAGDAPSSARRTHQRTSERLSLAADATV
jgi:hypothetical protein